MDDPAVKRKVILYPENRDVSFDDIKEGVASVGRVRGANPLGNGGWLLRMSTAIEAVEVLEAAKKGSILIGGKKAAGQRPAQGQATDANRIPIGGVSAARAPFKKGKENKRQRACTVIVGRIKPSTKDAVKKVVAFVSEAVGEVKSVQGPLTPTEIEEEQISLSQIEGRKVGGEATSSGVILAEFEGVANAFAAVKALHGKPVKGLSRPLWARQLGGEGAKIKYWRIIVRNLPWKIDADQLRKHMSLKNELFVWDSHVPKSPDGRCRGFGFVGYICRSDAERAIKKLNGTKVGGRTVVLDWAVGKKEFEALPKGENGEAPKNAEPSRDAEDDADDGSGDESESEISENEGEPDVGESEEEGVEEEKEEDIERLEQDESAMLERIISTFKKANSDNDKKVAEEKASRSLEHSEKGKLKRTREDDGEAITRTVFVSQVPMNAYRMDLQRVMAKFGEVVSCRMVIDKQTGKQTGKAFVEYKSPESAKKAVARHAESKSGKRERVSVNGHLVNIYLALGETGIQDLKKKKLSGGKRPDKRNLHLTDEGYIDPKSEAARGMSEGDLQTRERSQREKTTKLRNPNFYCSDTRLMIRNIPKEMTKKQLKKLCVNAVKERATQAKPKIVQTKILEGGGRGFVEFGKAEWAMCCLRSLNNNPTASGGFTKSKRPIVEFAVENAVLLRKKERIESAALQKRKDKEKEKGKQNGK